MRSTRTFLLLLVGLLVLIGTYFGYRAIKRAASSSDGPVAQASTPDYAEESDAARSGPTATMYAGNPTKWKSNFVSFPCKIMNVVSVEPGNAQANAMCGKGVTASGADFSNAATADISMKTMEDQAIMVLTGDKVANFDGGQIVTITGFTIGPVEGKNGLGVTMSYPVVKVDYAR